MSSLIDTKSILHVFILFILLLCYPGAAHSNEKAELVIVVKSEYRLYLIREGKLFASFPVVFGSNPKGHKQQQGDERTPEGEYVLDYKNANSSYYKSIHISYPNDQDRENMKKHGVSLGGEIMIHGQPNRWGKLPAKKPRARMVT